MEKWQVVGYRDVDFKDQRTGKSVTGYSLFLEREPETDKIHGVETQKIFISGDYVDYEPAVGDLIGILFNRYGKVQSIEII